jgi:hypothetical protein
MRLISLFVLSSTSLTIGCAGFIACAGKDLTCLQTRDEVHAQLGKPVVTGALWDGGSFEEYHSRRKIGEPMAPRVGPGYAMMWCATCGAIDLICVPGELFILGRHTFLGQTIRATYDSAGAVTGIALDGESLGFGWHRQDPDGAKTATDAPSEHQRLPPP